MRIERSTTSVSWIPSDSIPGLLRLPFARGIMHYDPPPPLTLTDVNGMRRRGEFRFANRLSAYVEVEDDQIIGCGYTGGKLMGLTPITAGPLRAMLPTKANRPELAEPETRLERALVDQVMQHEPRPAIRHLDAGEYLHRQESAATSVALILDGILEVRVDGRVVGHVGPGSVIGERASLEAGRRTADVRATTDVRIAEAPAGSFDFEHLSELAPGHHREDSA